MITVATHYHVSVFEKDTDGILIQRINYPRTCRMIHHSNMISDKDEVVKHLTKLLNTHPEYADNPYRIEKTYIFSRKDKNGYWISRRRVTHVSELTKQDIETIK